MRKGTDLPAGRPGFERTALGLVIAAFLAWFVVVGPAGAASPSGRGLGLAVGGVLGVANGDAFSFFVRGYFYISRNLSIGGVVFKLDELGVPGMTSSASSAVAWVYTIVLAGLTVVAGSREKDRVGEAATWLGLLVLGSLRSPLAPSIYATAPVMWLLAQRPTRGAAGVVALVVAWFVVSGPPPLPGPTVEIVVMLATQVVVVGIAAAAVLRPPSAA